MKKQAEIDALIKKFDMKPHPEGGHYVEIFRSKNHIKVSKEIYGEENRTCCTSIYYMMLSGNFSAWHKLKSDEVWSYHHGSPVTILTLDQEGVLSQYLLGNPVKDDKSVFQIIVPAGIWFSASVNEKDSFSFVGCFVAPAFNFSDFELADRSKLIAAYPQHKEVIKAFTRVSGEEKASSHSKDKVSISQGIESTMLSTSGKRKQVDEDGSQKNENHYCIIL